MKARLIFMYLRYVNDFISTSAFAEYYGITKDKAFRIIGLGRRLNNALVEKRTN